MSILEQFIRRPVMAAMLSLALLVFGALAYARLPVREFPDADAPVVSVTTILPGANPRVVESAVTDVLENELGSIDGLRTLTSSSREQVSSITLEFSLDRDIEAAAQDVRDKVSRARGELPADVEEPVVAKQEADASPVLFLGVSSKDGDLLTLTDVAERIVKQRVERLPGVARAELYGERRFAMRVWIDNRALTAHGLTVQEVERAIRTRSVEIPGGRIESTDREFTVRSLGELRTPEEFADLTVSSVGGQLVKLRDVARVELGPRDDRVSFRADREPTVGVGVVRQSRSNLLDVAKAVEAELPAIRAALPAGVTVKTVYETAQYVERSILEAEETLLIAAGLVIVIIFLFLRTLRGTLIPAIAIPVSIVATFGVMLALDYSINNFTLLALILAIGIVVDDAIIVLENAYRRQEELGEDPETAAVRGTKEIAPAVIAVTLSLIAVFMPLAFLTGTTGRLLNEFGVAVAAAVGISGFVALTLTPVLCARFLRLPKQKSRFYEGMGRALDTMASRYKASLARALERRAWILSGGVLTAVVAVVLLGRLPREFVPPDDRGYFITAVIAPDGATSEYTGRYQRQLEDILAETPDVHNQVSVLGWPEDPTRGLIFGMLDDWDTRKRDAFSIIGEVQPKYFGIPGVLAFAVNPPPLASSGGGQAPVQYVVQHPQFDSLVAGMQRFVGRARQVPGLINVDVDLRVTKPELTVAFDRDRAEDLGVSIADAAATLQSLLSDREVARYTKDNEQYDVVVRLRPEDRTTPDAISKLFVRGRDGALVQLSSIATVTEDVGPRSLNHFNRVRSFTVTASLAPGVTLGAALDSLDLIAKATLPSGSSQALSGESRELRESGSALYFAFGLALLVVYMVLASQFGSLVHPFTVLLAVPLAVTGALLALWMTGSTMNLYSQIGMILLIGLAAKNSILLVEYINHLKGEGMELVEAILEAGRIRLRPILMTSVAALLGAVPIAFGLGAGSASRRPLGLAVVGGLIFSTAFTLYLVPVVYLVLDRLRERFASTARDNAVASGLTPGVARTLVMIAAIAGAASLAGAQSTTQMPNVSLAEAVQMAERVDPSLIAASGQVGTAAWLQRSARAALFLPSISASTDVTRFSAPAFNIGTLRPGTQVVTGQLLASYDLYLGGRQVARLRQATTAARSADAQEVQARFATALEATADYYGVVTGRELRAVAADRVRRAEEQLGVARARVTLGAAVPTDSLQVVLELTRARFELLEREAGLEVARLRLGRRVGLSGAVDAAASDTAVVAALPFAADDAVRRALAQGPGYVAVRAEERAADAALDAERSAYLPKVSVVAAAGSYDDGFFPKAAYRSQIGVAVSLPIWDNGARELSIAQARVARDVARARRRDAERAAVEEATAAHTSFTTARAGIDLATTGVAVARETMRVQDARYRAGETTILDILEAQGALSRAEADLVQARQRARIALAQLESILGQRVATRSGANDND